VAGRQKSVSQFESFGRRVIIPPRHNCCGSYGKKLFEIDKNYPLFLNQESAGVSGICPARGYVFDRYAPSSKETGPFKLVFHVDTAQAGYARAQFRRDFKNFRQQHADYGQTVTDHYFPGGLWTAGFSSFRALPETARH